MNLPRIIGSRQIVAATLALLVLLLAARLGMPFLVPTASIGEDIRKSIASWTGAEVEFASAPQFDFWPYPKVTLRDVRLFSAGADSRNDLLQAKEVSASFNLIGALRGSPEFHDFELVGPVVHVAWNGNGASNWPRNGWIEDAIASAAGPAAADPPILRHDRIGTVTVVNGQFSVEDARQGRFYRISGVNGTARWPAVNKSLGISLSGSVNGKHAEWTFVCDRPLALIAGQNTNVSTAFSSEPVTMKFEGLANLSDNPYIAGDLRLGTPSLAHLLAWKGADIPAMGNLGQFNIEGRVTVAGHSAKLDNLQLGLPNSESTGVLEIDLPPQGRPRLDGTLAFDRIDLKALLSALSPLPSADGSIAAGIDTTFMRKFGVDLRLSARSASFEPFALSDLAAGLMVEDGRASFDIGDSTFMGGQLSGRIALTEEGFQGGGQLQMSLKDADIAGIIGTLGLSGPLPSGRGSADFELSTDLPLWATGSSDLSGVFRLRMGSGVLTRFNRQRFEDLLATDNFFNVTEAADGNFEFVRADIEAKLDRGSAELTTATIEGADKTLTFSGMIPYRSGSVALAGTIADTAQNSAAGRPAASFFVGGSWPEPVISPLSVLTGTSGE
ncbi:MAG: AsmA-like C-terminal region-containing protein [Shinella sp.]|nr:AsmA-like C-terminal region-containing protein [Shinella sp.]